MFVALLALLLCSLSCSHAEEESYDPKVVKFTLEVLRVVVVDERTEEVEFDCVLRMSWNPWDLKNAGNANHPSLTWRPDVIPYESALDVFGESTITYNSIKEVTWARHLHTRVPCEILWPSGDAHCQISFTSRSHDFYTLSLEGKDFDFLRLPDDETSVSESGYYLRSAGLIGSSREDPCCESRVDVISFPINLAKS